MVVKVLEILGGEYAALQYEDAIKMGQTDNEELWEVAKENTQSVFEHNDIYFEYIGHEFGDVDPKFIDFIRNDMQDYDDSKHHNFYVLE